jgi:threonine/homoserine/homoserine lactone efflux protein
MELFFSTLLISYSGAMMPGPLLTYTLERSLSRGWRTGLLVPLGHVLLEIVIVLLLALGLGSFLNHPWPKTVVLFLGGIVLLWFGFGMVKSAIRGNIRMEASAPAGGLSGDIETVVKSAAISLVNPYFLIWWATIGLGLMLANTAMGAWGVVIFYLGHVTADFTWYFAVGLLCGKIGKFISGKPYRVIIGALGAVLGYFAVTFIADGMRLLLQTVS